MRRVLIILVVILFGVLGAAHADIINGGFEDGLDSWTNNVSHGIYETSVVASYTAGNYFFAPREGDSMLQIYMYNAAGATYQDLYLNQGDTIQGYAGLDLIDQLMNFSIIYSYVSILDQDGNLVQRLWEGANSENDNDWDLWSWNANSAGNYRLEFSFDPFLSGNHEGYAFFDAIEVIEAGSQSAPVPEPSTMLLLGAGIIGLAGLRKKFTR